MSEHTSTRLTAEQRASLLADSFPVLRSAPIHPFNADALDRFARVASSGEREAILFVLTVYNHSHKWKAGRFDLMHAVNVWDRGNLAAFQAWAQNPFTL